MKEKLKQLKFIYETKIKLIEDDLEDGNQNTLEECDQYPVGYITTIPLEDAKNIIKTHSLISDQKKYRIFVSELEEIMSTC